MIFVDQNNKDKAICAGCVSYTAGLLMDKANAIALPCLEVNRPNELTVNIEPSPVHCKSDVASRAWTVQVLSGQGEVVWKWNAADQFDTSGDAWKNDGHRLIAAVIYCLSNASLQAEKMPDDPNWIYPFDLAKGTFHRCGKQIALGEVPLTATCACQHSHQHRSNTADQLV